MKILFLSVLVAVMLCGCNRQTQPGSQASVEQVGAETGSLSAASKSSNASSNESSGIESSTGSSLLSKNKIGWGQGYNVNEKNQPISCIDFEEKYSKYGGVFIGQDENTICLTFDEGYENGYTPMILDTLKEKQVKAVFFVTYDYVNRNPELVKRMIDEGHTLGNHSWSHPSMPTLTAEEMESEIQRLHEFVQDNFGYKMTLFRPPMGEFSEQSLAVAQQLGYRSVFWSFAYKDYDVNAQPEKSAAFDRITSAAHDGAIYLLHAVSETNTEILGDVIDQLRYDGYEFNVISF